MAKTDDLRVVAAAQAIGDVIHRDHPQVSGWVSAALCRRLAVVALTAADKAGPTVPMLRDGDRWVDPWERLRSRDQELDALVDAQEELLRQCELKFPAGQSKVLPGPSLFAAMERAREGLRSG